MKKEEIIKEKIRKGLAKIMDGYFDLVDGYIELEDFIFAPKQEILEKIEKLDGRIAVGEKIIEDDLRKGYQQALQDIKEIIKEVGIK